MKALTERQEQILAFIIRRTREQGYPPTFREIGDHFRIASTNGVMKNLAALERKGYIRRKDRASRAIEIRAAAYEVEGEGLGDPGSAPASNVVPVDFRRSTTTLPLIGRIAAGLPIEAVETPEVIDVGASFATDASYVLQVQGDSMIEDCIADGDYVIVERRETAGNGDIVVALVNGDEATLKRFYRERDGRIRLQPANARMAPIYPERVEVRGIVVGVMRRYR